MRDRESFTRALGHSIACFVPLALAACAEPRVSLAPGPREYIPSDYASVLQRWTRDGSLLVMGELDSKLTATATYESWDFRWAYVIRYAADYRLTVAQRKDVLDRTLAETADLHEFFVAVYGASADWRWLDLSRPSSAWTVRLIDDQGSETAPSNIELIARLSPLERRYFPYTNVWRRAFRIRFPRQAADGHATIAGDARWFGLRFAGAEGSTELRWELMSPGPGSAAL
ncbi:MAG: hypothetical protein ABTD50_16095 [Polyangiaceae bacterium]|jgi:hypothetical protein